MTHRILLIGEDFGVHDPPFPENRALTGASGKRLAALAGVSFGWYIALTERRNVVRDPRTWRDRHAIAERSEWLRRMIGEHGRAIVLGRRAASALGLAGASWATWHVPERTPIAVIPHPSGRNLLYNDVDLRRHVEAFLRPTFADARDRYHAIAEARSIRGGGAPE